MTQRHNQQPNDSILHESGQVLSELSEGFHIMRAHDCTPNILSREFRSAYGLGLAAEHAAMIEALGSVGDALLDPKQAVHNPELVSLSEKKPAFFALSTNLISNELRTAKNQFKADEAGVILRVAYTQHPLYGGKIESFPAILKDNEMYRVLVTNTPKGDVRSDDEIEDSLGLITLPTKVSTNEDTRYAAMLFVEHEGHPASITKQELDDWMIRYREAGLNIGSDIGVKDESLDNFIRYQGRLYWCDGDVIAAQQLKRVEEEQKIHAMKQTLEHFVR